MEEPNFYEDLEEKTKALVEPLKEFPVTIQQVGSLFSIHFGRSEIKNFEDILACDLGEFRKMFHHLFEMGIYPPPHFAESWFVSAAHTEEQIAYTRDTITTYLSESGIMKIMRYLWLLFLPFLLSADFKEFIHPESNRVGLIQITDKSKEINQGTWFYVYKALEHFKAEKPDFIILQMNTPGGEVIAAQKISDALKEMDIQYGIPIVCFIDNWAISAGAMIAYSCRFITTTKDGAMGAAEPVILGSSGQLEAASEKVNSAMRADMANRAQFFGRNPFIAEKMVDKDLILVDRNGNLIALNKEEDIQHGDVVVSPKGKLLTLDAQDMVKYGVADIMLQPTKLEPITPEELAKGEWPLSKMLLGTYPFFKEIPNATVELFQMDLKTKFFSWLLSPAISSLLLLGLMFGVYFELSHPGFGLPGSIAVICLLLIIMSSFAFEIGNVFELVLIGLGIAIIVIDLFFLPTFGLLGFFGVAAFLAGLFGLMIPGLENFHYNVDTGQLSEAGKEVIERLGMLFGTVLLGLAGIVIISRFAGYRFSPFNRLVLKTDQEGYQAGNQAQFPPVGTKGKTVSPLRPSGVVELDGDVYDAQSSGEYIDKEVPIVLTRVEGSRLFVKEIK